MECAAVQSIAPAAGHLVCIVQSSSIVSWFAPAIAAAAALGAARIALDNIDNAKIIARNKATLDLIEKTESAEHYRLLTTAFTTVRVEDGFKHLVAPTDDASRAIRRQIIDYLNHYELVAIGIQHRVLDAGIYRAWMEGAYIRDWNAAALWIQSVRAGTDANGAPTYDQKAYLNFEQAAQAWSAVPWWLQSGAPRPPEARIAVQLTRDTPPLVHVDAPDPILPSDSEPI